jgi:hypothetical protein
MSSLKAEKVIHLMVAKKERGREKELRIYFIFFRAYLQ